MTALRRLRVLPLLALLAAVGGLVAGCGGSDRVVDVGASPTPRRPAGPTALSVSVSGTNTVLHSWTLTCDPAGGSHPHPADACGALARHAGAALPPVAADTACDQIYGGPQTATVTGTWRGAAVSASFSRTNGCEIARWDALAGLFGAISPSAVPVDPNQPRPPGTKPGHPGSDPVLPPTR
jgi:hypothetical protein